MADSETPTTEAQAEKPAAKKPVKKEAEPPKDFASAVRMSDAGKAGDALPFFQELVGKEPDNAEAWRELGIAQFRKDSFEEAVASLEKATALQSQDTRAWFFLGATYRESRRPWDAEKAYQRVVELAPDHKEAPDDLKGVQIALAILRARGQLKAA